MHNVLFVQYDRPVCQEICGALKHIIFFLLLYFTLPLHTEFVTMSLEYEYCHLNTSPSDLTVNCSWGPAFAFFRYFFWNLGKLWLKFAQRHLDSFMMCKWNKCRFHIFTKFTLPSNITIVRLPILFDQW